MSVRVLVVDDSAFFRKRVCEILESVASITVVGTASNGREGVEQVAKLKPDVVTMDYEMPVMDGVTAVRNIMASHPTPVLMFSSLTYEGARVTLDALDAGAVDFLPKNFEDIARDASKIQTVLKQRILAIAKKPSRSSPARPLERSADRRSAPVANPDAPKARTASALKTALESASTPQRAEGGRGRRKLRHKVDLLVIGTSTGGPVALQKIITRLPAALPVPILLIQHMPATFTPAFAERLNGLSAIEVKHAEDGDVLRKGQALLAPGGMQMVLKQAPSGTQVNILEGDERLTYKPSVDLTFGSASRAYPGKVLAVVLTGMGADGREGCRLLKSAGSSVWTQSEQSCVVYGMPMSVDRAGYSDASFDVSEIANQITSELM